MVEELARPPKNGMPPIHPGEILAEDLEELGLTAEEFDKILAVTPGTVCAILEGRCNIDAEFALRLSRYIGTGARLWMNLQVSYDLKVAMRDIGHQIKKQVQPRPNMPMMPEDWHV